MAPASRRMLLRFAAALPAFAGCLGSPGDSSSPSESPTETPTTTPTQPFEIPEPGECAVTEPPQPTPTERFEPKSYPTYPDELTRESTEGFATRFERAFQYNAYLATGVDSKTSTLDVQADARTDLTEPVDGGFLVGVDGERSTERGEKTYVVSDDPLVGVYYLTPETAIRGHIPEPTLHEVESLRTVSIEDQMVVRCTDAPRN